MINKEDFKHGEIIFSVLTGSHAHGTNTESSDEDYKHIYIQSPEDVIENGYRGQIDINEDEVVYELGRFVELALKGNPTMLEILFIPEDCIKYKNPLIQPLLDNRKEFLCKVLKLPFIGYSYSQIEKAQGLNKKMNWEKDKTVRKTVLDFCYVIDPDDQFNTLPLKNYLKRENRKQEHYGLSKINHFTDCYMMYYDVQAELSSSNPKFTSTVFNYKGIVQDEDKSNEVSLSDIPKYAQRDAVMFWNKNEYQRHCREYREYTEWLNKRNTQRYIDVENHNQQIDCYVTHVTEFLTQDGFKRYENILDTDLIGSLDLTGKVIFDTPISKFAYKYSGKIYHYESRYSKFSVTPNHNIYLKYISRKPSNNFKPDRHLENVEGFEFVKVEDYHLRRKNHCLFIKTPLYPISNNEYPLTDEQIKILGAYISDGCINGKSIRIDQSMDKPLWKKLNNMQYSYKSKYKGSFTGLEYYYFKFKDLSLLDFIYENVGVGSLNKYLSSEFFKFSKRQVNLLLEYMILGDGHIHNKGYSIYYTSSYNLASSLQTLLFLNGESSQIYTVKHKGGFTNSSSIKYQVFIPRINKNSIQVSKNKNWSIEEVDNIDVSCIHTKYGNVITRNNHKISIQGNSKNVSHCIRLIDSAIDIVKHKDFIVRRPNASFLIDVRKGKYSLEKVLEYCDKKIETLDEAFDKSDLPKYSNKDLIEKTIKNIRYLHYGKKTK